MKLILSILPKAQLEIWPKIKKRLTKVALSIEAIPKIKLLSKTI